MSDEPRAESPSYPGAPRWVKVLGIIAVALVAVFITVHLAGGGFRHAHVGQGSSSDAIDNAK